jgi:hypothetical protein
VARALIERETLDGTGLRDLLDVARDKSAESFTNI